MVQFNQDLRFVQALDEHLTAGHRILSAPDYAQARINEPYLFNEWSRVLSLRIGGMDEEGKPTALYWHPVIKSIDDLRTIAGELKSWYAQGLTDSSALKVPRDKYLTLLKEAISQTGKSRTLWYIPSSLLQISKSGIVDLDNALNHTEIVPFLGSVDLARGYVQTMRTLSKRNIGVWHRKEDSNTDNPQGRVLVFGADDGNNLSAYLGAGNYYVYIWRFAGVPFGAEGAAQKNSPSPNSFLERLLNSP